MKKSENPYMALERNFHEPSRLAIMSALCGAATGMSFNDLKDECGLTDGNLSRHLSKLKVAKAVQIKKTFIGSVPHTTVVMSDIGRDSFLEYLHALEIVLERAVEAVSSEEVVIPLPLGQQVASV